MRWFVTPQTPHLQFNEVLSRSFISYVEYLMYGNLSCVFYISELEVMKIARFAG